MVKTITAQVFGQDIAIDIPGTPKAEDLITWRLNPTGKELQTLKKSIDLVSETGIPELVFEIGSEIGVYSVVLARFFRKVIAVEPDMQHQIYLNRNASREENIVVVAKACDNKITQRLMFTDNEVGSGRCPTLCKQIASTKKYKGRRMVDTTTIDDLANEYGVPSMIKIDVEGWDDRVLQGGIETLKKTGLVQIEIHDFENKEIGSRSREILGNSLLRLHSSSRRGNEWLEIWKR